MTATADVARVSDVHAHSTSHQPPLLFHAISCVGVSIAKA